MSTNTIRLLGILFLVAGAVAGILNLRRVADLGMGWLPPILVVLGVALVLNSKRRV